MADITVDIPGVGSVDFPETMSGDEISAAAKRLHDEAHPQSSLGRQIGRAALNSLPGIGAMVGGVLSTPETFGAGTIPGIALGAGAGQGLRDLIGHVTGLDAPTTPTQKAMNIGKETAISGATAAVMPGLAEAAKAPIQTVREGAEQIGSAMPPAIRRLGRLLPSVPASGEGRILTRPAWQTWEGAAPAAGGGATPAVAEAATGLSDAERAGLAKQGYTPEVIARIEQAASGSPAQPTPMASHAPSAAPQPELQGPRIRTGAERVGRQAGMSTQDVRQAAGPVLDEARGEASPILPQNALGSIVDTLKAMPPGSPEREAYVARATSGKTKWQVENIRRTLEHLGLIVPAAVGVREGLMRMMASHEPTNATP